MECYEDAILHTNEKHDKKSKLVDSDRMLHSLFSIDSEDIIGCYEDATLHTNEEHD